MNNYRPNQKLPLSFYQQNVLTLAPNLLAKRLVIRQQNKLLSGIIVEVEAYGGSDDKASHAYQNKRTQRTDTMFLAGGHCYVYFIYGKYYQFNIVSGEKDNPEAVLIRALEPEKGIKIMQKNRQKGKLTDLCTGPGKLSMALAINKKHNRLCLDSDQIWLETTDIILKESDIITGKRIGIDYAKEYAEKPWRFGIKNSPYLSRPFK